MGYLCAANEPQKKSLIIFICIILFLMQLHKKLVVRFFVTVTFL